MKKWTHMWGNIALLSQLGLSLTVPLLICLFICSWICKWSGLGGWVYIPGFLFGLGGSAATAFKLYKSIVGNDEKKRRSRGPSFNRHT